MISRKLSAAVVAATALAIGAAPAVAAAADPPANHIIAVLIALETSPAPPLALTMPGSSTWGN